MPARFASNIPAITTHAWLAIRNIDQGFVGTPDYMGVAYFWAHAYKHSLRDASSHKRRITHDRFMAAGLDLDGVSDRHADIVRAVFGNTL